MPRASPLVGLLLVTVACKPGPVEQPASEDEQLSPSLEQAETALGDRFDIAAFHDVILAGGAVTLPILRQRVEAWIAGR